MVWSAAKYAALPGFHPFELHDGEYHEKSRTTTTKYMPAKEITVSDASIVSQYPRLTLVPEVQEDRFLGKQSELGCWIEADRCSPIHPKGL